MPHLDTSYFLSQIFWSIFIFLLIYLTASKSFCNKYDKTISARENKVHDYLSKTKKMLKDISDIERKIEASKRDVAEKVRALEREAKQKMLDTRNRRLNSLKNEIESKNLAHDSYLNELGASVMLNSGEYTKDVNKVLTSYLFER